MREYEPDRVVRLLGALASTVYVLAWVEALLALAAIPVARLLGADRADAHFRVAAPVTVHPTLDMAREWRMRGAQVQVSQVRATASVPMSSAPVGFLALTWLAVAGLWALVLGFLHQLRWLMRRVRQGAPFDAGNAARFRWLGILLLAATVWKGATDLWMSLAVSRMLEGPGDVLGTGLSLNLPVVFLALVFLALAEIFRRGAALEDEHALVV